MMNLLLHEILRFTGPCLSIARIVVIIIIIVTY